LNASRDRADYIVKAYVRADDALREYEQTLNRKFLKQAAAALCDGLAALEGDDDLWSELTTIRSSREAEPLFATLNDVNELLRQERQVLREANMPPSAIERVMAIADAISRFPDFPDRPEAERIREALSVAQRASCMEASFRSVRSLRRIRRVVLAGTGGAVMAVNTTYTDSLLATFSVYLGEKMIDLSAPDEIDLSEIIKL